MSRVTVVWSMVAASCLTLSAQHALIGLRRHARSNLLFALSGVSAAAIAAFELALMRSASVPDYGLLLRWIQVPILFLVASLVLFVRSHFRAGPRWLAAAVIATRAAALLVGFLRTPNLNFVEISALRRVPFLGEDVSVAEGTVSRWTRLGEASSLLLLAFLVSAAVATWRRGERRRAVLVEGSMILFVVAAAGQSALVHAGVVTLPYLVSVAYLGIVAAMSYELSRDVVRSAELARDLQSSDLALLETDRRLTLAADAANIGFWSWDIGRDDVWMTPRERALRGDADGERIDGVRLFSSVHPEDRDGLRQALAAAIESGQGFDWEHRILRPDGEVRWISLHGAVGADPSGGRLRVQAASIDVTSRKVAEVEAARRQADLAHLSRVTMLGELSGSLAHELNQPLTAIVSNAQAAQRFLAAGTGTGEVGEILADIVHEGKHASEVIERLRLLLRRRGDPSRPSRARRRGRRSPAARPGGARRQWRVGHDRSPERPSQGPR